MLMEMHAHTLEHSRCSHVPAVELVRRCLEKGLQGVVLTDHHYLWPPEELAKLRREARVPEDFLILSGQETRTRDFGDVLVYDAGQILDEGITLEEIRKRFPGAALVWAHPYRKARRPADEELLHPVWNGIEIFNSNHTVRENSRGLRDWHRLRYTAIAGTDTHGLSYAGLYPTLFDHPLGGIGDLTGEVRAGRCRPFYKEIPRSGSHSVVTEVTFGAKGRDEVRERIIIRQTEGSRRWQSAERAHRVMAAIGQAGFSGGTFRVPAAIDQDPEGHILIQEGLRGKSLYERLLTAPEPEGRHYLQLAARWLARLHSCRLALTPAEEFMRLEERRLARYLGRFSRLGHPFTRRAEELRQVLIAREEALLAGYREGMIQGHGDYHPKNIIIGQDRQEDRGTLFVAAVDFESSLRTWPAFDVGTFLAQFRNQFFGRQDILRRYPAETFLLAYRKECRDLPADFAGQVATFSARTNLGIAAYLIKLGLGGSEDLHRVLLEAEQALSLAAAGEQPGPPLASREDDSWANV